MYTIPIAEFVGGMAGRGGAACVASAGNGAEEPQRISIIVNELYACQDFTIGVWKGNGVGSEKLMCAQLREERPGA